MIFRRRFASRASRRAEKIQAQVVVVYVCVCVCVCVFLLEGMNPNEIFYGPVDLLIVPQVLSLLTTHFFIFQGDPLGSALLRLTSLLPVFSSFPEGDSLPLPPPLAFTQLLLAIKRETITNFRWPLKATCSSEALLVHVKKLLSRVFSAPFMTK